MKCNHAIQKPRKHPRCRSLAKLREGYSASALSVIAAAAAVPDGLTIGQAIISRAIRLYPSALDIAHYENGLALPSAEVRRRLTLAVSRVHGRSFSVSEVFPELELERDEYRNPQPVQAGTVARQVQPQRVQNVG